MLCTQTPWEVPATLEAGPGPKVWKSPSGEVGPNFSGDKLPGTSPKLRVDRLVSEEGGVYGPLSTILTPVLGLLPVQVSNAPRPGQAGCNKTAVCPGL